MAKTIRRRAFHIHLLHLAVAATLLGVDAPASAQTTTLKVVFPTTIDTFALPYLVAKKKGWFKEGGVEVEEVFVRGGSTAVRLLVGGSEDVAIVGLAAVFNAVLEGANLKSIGSWQPLPDYKLVAGKAAAQKISDLAGKTIAVAEPGDATAFLPLMIMRKHGVATGDTKFVSTGGHPTRLLAVSADRAQATILNSRTTILGESSGKINVLTSVSNELPSFGYVVSAVNENRLTNPAKRKALETFVEAGIRGARFVMANPDEAASILQERMPDVPAADLLAAVRDLNAAKLWGVDGGSSLEILRFSYQASREYGALARDLEIEKVFDGTLVDAALKKLGKAP